MSPIVIEPTTKVKSTFGKREISGSHGGEYEV
jgi:hypothetical protein